jgi:hypothetical protein
MLLPRPCRPAPHGRRMRAPPSGRPCAARTNGGAGPGVAVKTPIRGTISAPASRQTALAGTLVTTNGTDANRTSPQAAGFGTGSACTAGWSGCCRRHRSLRCGYRRNLDSSRLAHPPPRQSTSRSREWHRPAGVKGRRRPVFACRRRPRPGDRDTACLPQEAPSFRQIETASGSTALHERKSVRRSRGTTRGSRTAAGGGARHRSVPALRGGWTATRCRNVCTGTRGPPAARNVTPAG